MITPEEVKRILNSIDDPCSVAAGCAAGIVEMGLVKVIEIGAGAEGTAISVTLRATDSGCLMTGLFVSEARKRLAACPEVAHVRVTLCHADDWTEASMATAYRRRLEAVRARLRAARAGTLPAVSS
jgi:metal-sulfur cluster biosynthetic enzyme